MTTPRETLEALARDARDLSDRIVEAANAADAAGEDNLYWNLRGITGTADTVARSLDRLHQETT